MVCSDECLLCSAGSECETVQSIDIRQSYQIISSVYISQVTNIIYHPTLLWEHIIILLLHAYTIFSCLSYA